MREQMRESRRDHGQASLEEGKERLVHVDGSMAIVQHRDFRTHWALKVMTELH